MSLFQEITKVYVDLMDNDFNPMQGSILLADDGDGVQYISKWEYSKPLPDGMKVGK